VALASSGVSQEQAAPLVGYFDRVNGMQGHELQKIHHIATGLAPLPNVPRIETTPVAQQQLIAH
jgi:hypothetical protein